MSYSLSENIEEVALSIWQTFLFLLRLLLLPVYRNIGKQLSNADVINETLGVVCFVHIITLYNNVCTAVLTK